LNNLERGINDGINFLKRGGRFCIISFHSLEDRIVKRFFRDLEKEGVPSVSARFKVLTKKPISPQSSEVVMNPRARSSKLRAIERVRDS
jgi:16S rRNA (cytosine1402-N4)-methyltransferase